MSRFRLAAAALFSVVLPLVAQTTATPTPPTHPTSNPYTGDLSIFEEAGRDQKLQIDRVMDTLKLHPGSNVADIGAGGGWFSVRAAKRVAGGDRSGTVYAEDINAHAVEAIHDRATKENLPNIAAVLGTPDDPKLPADTLDAALMLRVYHEIAHPPTLLANLRTAMKSGGLFGVIDHPGHGDDHGINAEVVIAEVQRAGFRFVKQYDFTKGDQNDYFLVFERP